jgi:hypothetical protein
MAVIIDPQCSWNDHPWAFPACRKREFYRRSLRRCCYCLASRLGMRDFNRWLIDGSTGGGGASENKCLSPGRRFAAEARKARHDS